MSFELVVLVVFFVCATGKFSSHVFQAQTRGPKKGAHEETGCPESVDSDSELGAARQFERTYGGILRSREVHCYARDARPARLRSRASAEALPKGVRVRKSRNVAYGCLRRWLIGLELTAARRNYGAGVHKLFFVRILPRLWYVFYYNNINKFVSR